jgi:protein-L-isoaspartate(D-aspartate) O-methyltransferase
MTADPRPDFIKRRTRMVVESLHGRDIRDQRILDAFQQVPRHLFIDRAMWPKAYGDHPLPIGAQQTISQPYIVAKMLQELELHPEHKVLEIGTGSGYQTAILARLVRQVFSIERIAELARGAQTALAELGVLNTTVKVFDGTYGWSEMAPFDRIIVSAAAPLVPEPLTAQLAPRGRLLVPVGDTASQTLKLVTRTESGALMEEELDGCVFVKLVGRYGWEK